VASFLRVSQCDIQDDWFREFEIPADLVSVKRVEIDGLIYFLDTNLTDQGVALVLIALGDRHPVFRADKVDRYTFDRIATVVRSVFTNSVAIPFNWHSRSEGSLSSIYVAAKTIGAGSRVHYDTNPAGTRDLLIFERTDEPIPFDKLKTPDEFYLQARDSLSKAIAATPARRATKSENTGINLSQRLPESFVRGASLETWYRVKLTDEQREFVDKPYVGPVRLRGAAGTGKTLALTIKFLHDSCKFEKEGVERRFCFLTHSSATVDLVSGICTELDPVGIFAGEGKCVSLQVRTLYELASEYLRFDLDQLSPLSIDGREGRLLQGELIQSVLDGMLTGLPRTRYDNVSPSIKEGWHDDRSAMPRERLVYELMNEFASVLDADGVWAGTEKGEKYAKGQFGYRPVWLMSLPAEPDRRFVLEVHRRYRKLLAEMNTLSVDQMVADFNSFLDRNTWDQVRKTKGFDAVFVDELHLFTSIERQVLHKLIRNTVSADGVVSRPPIFMAYDVKQSPHDTFSQFGDGDKSLFSQSSQLQNADLVKLSKAFRYTTQIAEFLYDLDATFPAIDLAGEWEAYTATAEVADGDRPVLKIFKDEAELYRRVMDAAVSHAKKLGGRRVAVLCVNERLFDQYDDISRKRYAGQLVHINSREPSLDLKHAGKKPIFSMPEYVAGLQFEAVYLIHVDAQDSPKEMNIGERRRFISNLYLGASRAERELVIASCESRGGPASILNLALDRKTLLHAL
jgi:hypothetical protein